MSDKIHRAARNNVLNTLKEATRRDCNQPDEDGVTPTAYAAHEGHLEALRILVGRGGDPDKCDHYGSTSLHCAAAKGHMVCVSFLVNFGANIWSLDNNFHTALELAAINNKDEVVRYLDIQAAKQEQDDMKKTKKIQEKTKKDAEKRQKEFDKIQRKADKKREEYHQKHQKEISVLMTKNNSVPDNEDVKKKSVFNTISRSTMIDFVKGSKVKDQKTTFSNSQTFSKLTQNSINGNKKTGGIQRMILKKKISHESSNDFKVRGIEENGIMSTRNLHGLQRDSEIIFLPNKSLSENKRGMISDVFDDSEEQIVQSYQPSSLFERPGLSIAFRNPVTSALSNILSDVSDTSDGSSSRFSNEDGKETSLDNSTPWDEDDLPSEDEIEDSPLFVFLLANGFQNYIAQFTREHVDLESLMLLTDQDLKQMNIQLGPRRKLLKVLNERRLALEDPTDEVMDIKL